MMKRKETKRNRIRVIIFAIMLLTAFAACGDNEKAEGGTIGIDGKYSTEDSDEPSLSDEASQRYQFRKPVDGDLIAEIDIGDFGEISLRLFPEYAPKAVQNFVSLAQEGYYDETPLFRVIDSYLVQGGDPKGDGTGGESIWGTVFEDEFSTELQPFRGALCMANLGRGDSNGSQFFLLQSKGSFLEEIKSLVEYKEYDFSEYLKAAYGIELTEQRLSDYYVYGGAPWLFGHHTVFGQIFEGFDVLDAVCSQETSSDYAPKEEILINTIKITEY